jgi:hypothetical protein
MGRLEGGIQWAIDGQKYSWSDWHNGSILRGLFSERVSAFGK